MNQLRKPPTQYQWQMKVYKDILLKKYFSVGDWYWVGGWHLRHRYPNLAPSCFGKTFLSMIIDWGWITLCQWIPSFDRTNHWSGWFSFQRHQSTDMPWYRTMNWWFRLLASYLMPYPIIHIPSWQRNISPTRALLNTFESMISNFPFPQVGYGLVPWEGILFYLEGSFHPFQFLRWTLAFLSLTVGSPIPAFRSTIPVAAVSVVPTPPPTNLPTTPQPQLFLGRCRRTGHKKSWKNC